MPNRVLPLVCAGLLAVLPLTAEAAGGEASKPKDQPNAPRKITDSQTFLQFPAISAAVVRDGLIRGMIFVEIGLDVPDSGLRHSAETLTPRLRDAWTSAMMRMGMSVLSHQRAPDPSAVSAALQAETDRVLGKLGAQVLLIHLYQKRRI